MSSNRLETLLKQGTLSTEGVLRGAILNCAGVNLSPSTMASRPVEVTLLHGARVIARIRLARRSGFQFIISGLGRGAGSDPYVGSVSFILETNSGLKTSMRLGGGIGEVSAQLQPDRSNCAPRTSSTSSCVADLDRSPADIPMPKPTRLKATKQFFGFSFTPVDAQFTPRASASVAWRKFNEKSQSTATFEIFLARFHPDNPAGTNTRLKTQIVWVALGKHIAYQPSAGPLGNSSKQGCEFGTSMTVVNADTSLYIVSAG
jgi:hypothetical protein